MIAVIERKRRIRRSRECLAPARTLVAEAAFSGGEEQALVAMARIGGDGEPETVEPADRVILDHHLAFRADHHRQRAAISADLAEQHGRALVDETLGEAEMERVGQPLLDRSGAGSPMRRISEPVGAVGDISPASRRRDAPRERLDIARDIIEPGDLLGEPAMRYMALPFAQMPEQTADEAGMRIDAELAEIGQAGRCPEPRHHRWRSHAIPYPVLLGEALEHGEISRLRCGAQYPLGGPCLEAGNKRVDA